MNRYKVGNEITIYPLRRVVILLATEDGKKVYAGGKWHDVAELEEYRQFLLEQVMKEKK